MNFRTIADLNDCIMKNIYKVPDTDIVIGIPRSGLLPATLLSLYLNKPMSTLYGFTKGEIYLGGPRGKITKPQIKRVIVIDDSVLMGSAMKEAKKILKNQDIQFYFGAVYAAEKAVNKVDFFFEICPMPRVFEWNLMHHSILPKCCMDIDGILCLDPSHEENDDGKKYQEFLLETNPLFIPTYPIGCLVSNRLEKYRKETEIWLGKHGIQYHKLYLAQYPTQKARRIAGEYSKLKSEVYLKEKDTVLFVESDIRQAADIFKRTGKPVYCLPQHEFFK